MKRVLLPLLALSFSLYALAGEPTPRPVWIEADSAAAIKSRLLHDFSITYDSAVNMIVHMYPGTTPDDVARFAKEKYIEVKEIDGVKRVHRKSPRNLVLLNPDMNGGWKHRGWNASPARLAYVDSVLDAQAGTNPVGAAHLVKYKFEIDVPYHPALKDDTVRVWMPIPFESQRQSDVRVLEASHPDYVLSKNSAHSTLYMQQPVVEGRDMHFEYTGSFVTRGQYFSPEYIMANIRPYDKESAEYQYYTAVQPPHMIHDSLAYAIVGDETNPYLCSELVYDYIIQHYPWAGAREYSTLECIPQYVLDQGHGDCGQVTLLYISLMRTLGIPARWESGWMLHPHEVNMHDWGEVYFEGVGWVPVDCSFGRYTGSSRPEAVKFYSTGIDAHRMATNHAVSDALDPVKRFVRSETVDFQLGEVETSMGNVFYPGWSQEMTVISVVPVE